MIYDDAIRTLLDLLRRRNSAGRLWNAAKLWLSYETHVRFLEGRFSPLAVSIEVATVCNYACRACRHGFPEGKHDRPGVPRYMDYHAFRRIVDDLAAHTHVHTIDLTGEGEAMLHPRAYDILKYASRKDFRVGLDTNGSVLDVDRLLDANISYIQLALDGFSEESYSKYRKPGMFETVLANICGLCRAIDQRQSKMRVYVKYLVNRYTEGEVDEAEGFFRRYGCVRFVRESFGIPFPDYRWLREREHAASAALHEEWAPRKLKAYDRYRRNPDDGTYVLQSMLSPITGRCRAFDIGAYINADGRLFPCCKVSRFELEDLCYGNVFQQRFLDLYWGQRANDIRQKYYRSHGHYSYCVNCPANRG